MATLAFHDSNWVDQGKVQISLSNINNIVDRSKYSGAILVFCAHILSRCFGQIFYVLIKTKLHSTQTTTL